MYKHSQTLVALAATSLLAAFAAQANKGAEYHASKHHEGHKFFITGGATYLEPSLNSLDYLNIIQPNTPNETLDTYTVDPEFNWGYYIGAGYKISHHYDIQASWAQFNSSLNDSTAGIGSGSGRATEYITSNQAPIAAALTTERVEAESAETVNYSVFDATLGQYHNITEMLRARAFGGVRWAKVDATIENTYTRSFNPTEIYDNYSSTFSGAGPEAGLDLEYKVYDGLGVVGHLAAAFLIGQQEAKSDVFARPLYDVGNPRQQNVKSETVARMIPAMDAKLGLNWTTPSMHEAFGFAIEAGYQVAYYWDVVDQLQFTQFTTALTHNYENYGNMGPYLNLTAMF